MKALLVYFLLGQGADMATTAIALRRGCVEAAPGRVLHGALLPVKAGITVSLAVWLPTQHDVHPTATKAVALTFGTAGAAAAIWNATQLSHCHAETLAR